MRMSRRQLIQHGRQALVELLKAHPGGLSAHQLGERMFPKDKPQEAARKAGLVAWWLRNDGQTTFIHFYGRKVHLLTDRGRANAQRIRG